ncbi:vitamin K epoxide reductase family protein [Homoserinibacter sp. GY 40078]|uniref:vitamin K epoxide reductase family protein n=1 Tax=Homoserinibacter sp. GY 40078 TaxID=2603275 RepID=UPI0011C7E552|nr:vitamin K epoxide reductase family protein [Homoserinibacter sp. GY 40078]TXK19723.1 vitamin K epoxide reductase family protein [Homoserinibacter sp. GY 40078]
MTATASAAYDDESDLVEFDEDQHSTPRRAWVFGIWLVLAGIIGEIAAFALTLEKIEVLKNPDAVLSCNVSVFVQCGKNLESWQGSLFGFPNPIIGLIAWMAPIVVGVAVLAGVRFPRWYWIVFNAGVALAVVFVIWLATQSIFDLNTLCPYCVLTWSITYPTFLAVTFRNMAEGVFGSGAQRAGRALQPWVAPISILIMVIIFVIAQTQFPVVQSLF